MSLSFVPWWSSLLDLAIAMICQCDVFSKMHISCTHKTIACGTAALDPTHEKFETGKGSGLSEVHRTGTAWGLFLGLKTICFPCLDENYLDDGRLR